MTKMENNERTREDTLKWRNLKLDWNVELICVRKFKKWSILLCKIQKLPKILNWFNYSKNKKRPKTFVVFLMIWKVEKNKEIEMPWKIKKRFEDNSCFHVGNLKKKKLIASFAYVNSQLTKQNSP